MTREEIFRLIIDFYQHMANHLDDMTKTVNMIENSILIPKPKFKEGDKVLWREYPEVKTIYEPVYYIKENVWRYLTYEGIKYLHEAELKLFKDKESKQ